MATAAGDSTRYGGGAGGKFRRRPFRRPQTTPYDRPPTALRITRRNDDRSSSVGWLSRIVDPASKLITASAHKLFSSVFRKRLLPPPQPSQDEEVEPLENHLGDAMTEAPSRIQERHTNEGNTCNGSMTDGVAELEDILKQKTFTKSEIDRLTVLLHSKKVDKTATEPPASHSRQNEFRGTAFENGFNPFEVSGADLTPAVRSNVNVGGVASPTELAKAYMGSMSTRVSPSMLGSHRQAVKEGSPAVTTHRTSVYTVQKPLTPAENSHKDFVVPRSRGRSAIYSMARTPYSRVQQTATKGLGTSNVAFDGNSLLSSQKTLKRRSSVLENDIGSVGPVRRIRQKPNLLYPKNLGLPSSCTSSTIATPSGVGEASSSKSHEDRGEKDPFSSSHVSSKSVEMGQRILQQLEKLTPPKDKSNEKKPGLSGGISGMELTPAMLSGQARKSLETLDSLKYVQSDVVCGKVVDSWNALRKAQDSTTKEQDKLNINISQMLMNSSSKVYHENGEASCTDHVVMGITKNTAPVVFKSTVDVPKRSPAFQMSAYEDDLDMDDDAFAMPSVNEGKRNLSESSVQSNGKLPDHPIFAEATKADRPAFPVVESSSNSALKNATTVDASNTAEKGIDHDFKDSVSNKKIGSSIPSLQPVQTSVSDKADVPASTISFGLKSSDKVSPPSFIASSAAESSSVKDVSSSVFAFGAASADAAVKSPGSNINSVEAVDLLKTADDAPTSLPGSSISTIGSFGSFPLTSAASAPVMFSSPSSFSVSATKVGADAVDSSATATAPINGGSNSVTASVAFPSFQSTFRGGSLDSDSATIAASGTHSAGKSKGTDLANSTSSNLLGEASVPAQGSAVASFQFGASTTSGTKSQAEASDNVSSRSIFGDQTLPSTTASASTTEGVISQPAGSALPASSVSSSLPMNTGSLPSASALFSSSFAFGSSSSGSTSMAAFGSVSSASTNIYGSSPQSTTSPVFGSALSNSPSGLSFGASASTPSSSTSSAFSFGTSSMSAPANGSSAVAPFGSSSTSIAAASTSSALPSLTFGASAAAPSGSVSSGFTFGTSSISAPANGASNGGSFGTSSTSAASSGTSSVFGASSSAASSAPSSTFLFGASPATASSTPSSTFSFGASPANATSSAPSSTFSFGASPTSASSGAPSSTFSFGASFASASSSAPSSPFSFGASSASSSAPSSAFSFGASSAPTSSSTPSTFLFGASSASATTAPAPVFPFGSAASTPSSTIQPSQPAFGTSSVFGFGSTPSSSPLGNNDQMSMEDSMVEDSMHQSPTIATPTPVFGQSPTSNFSFGMAQPQAPAQLGASPFQFGGQQNQVVASPNPFQASGSFDGGSFSLGAGGNDKSNRRIVKVKGRNRKK